MSYEPTEWKAGDTVTSAKLNKIEQGIITANSKGFIVTYNDNELTDKTWQEIYDAILNGQTIYLKDTRNNNIDIMSFQRIKHDDDDSPYYIMCNNIQYIAYSADDYLTIDG